MKHYEEVLKILHDKFDWKLTDSLTITGKKLVADTIKALKIAENNKNLQLQQTGVSGSTFDAIELWNKAPDELSLVECNGYWKALRDLEKQKVIKISGLDAD